MNGLNLRDMAIEILSIDREFYFHMNQESYKKGMRQSDYDLYTFEQLWGNTSGGFEGIGGSAMTTQRTYVFVPQHQLDEICLVFFGGRFAYKVPYSREFIDDVINQRVEGKSRSGKYLKTTWQIYLYHV